jgi:hypothetical protein
MRTVARYATGTSATSTFFAPVETLQPNGTGTTESVALSSLFDEMRTTSVDVYTRVQSGTTALIAAAWGVAFDPANSAAYTSVAGTLLAAQHIGPIAIGEGNTAGAVMAMNPTGFIHRRFKTMAAAPTAAASAANETVGGNWFATSDNAAVVGYVKFAIDAISGQSSTADLFVVFNTEYRSRT